MPADITIYAEPLDAWRVSDEGREALRTGAVPEPTGTPLQSIIDKKDANNNYRLYFSRRFREEHRHLARLTNDPGLAEFVAEPFVTIPVEHLLHLDPGTRIRTGFEVKYTEEQSRILSRSSMNR